MGPVALSAVELTAWASGAGVDLHPWEFKVLLKASRAYCGALNSSDPWPPYGDPDALYDDDVVAEKLEASLSRLG